MNQLNEGEDYYLNENGLMVLTAIFHLKKGFCCGNACKHCPYDYINVHEPVRSELLKKRADTDLKGGCDNSQTDK